MFTRGKPTPNSYLHTLSFLVDFEIVIMPTFLCHIEITLPLGKNGSRQVTGNLEPDLILVVRDSKKVVSMPQTYVFAIGTGPL